MGREIIDSVVNKYGEVVELIDYRGVNRAMVSLPGYNITKTTKYDTYIKGNITTPFSKTVYGVGFLGNDFYGYKGVSKLKEYHDWRNMLKRCYCDKALAVNDTYKNKSVCKEWHNFSTFYKWHKDNYYTIDNEVMCLDKDIVNKNCNMYSPENCVFVPMAINNTFPKCDKARGTLPIGVTWLKKDKIYGVSCRNAGTHEKWLGRYINKYEAFLAYKKEKERHIKYMADVYKDKIPEKLYIALYSYEVDIND